MSPMRLAALSLATLTLAATQQPYDQTFKPDIAAPDGFRTNRASYSAVMDVLNETRTDVTLAELSQLEGLQLENIWGAMGEYQDNYVRGFQTTRPGERIIGRALTIRTLPPRPDLERALKTLAKEGDWDSRFYVRAGEEAQEGDVVVVELGGGTGDVFFGDITAMGIQMRGARGVIIDGGTRDLEELSADLFKGFPVLARFFDPMGPNWLDTDYNVPIRVGGATVLPGDIVVAEDEAILFFPAEILPDVVEKARARQELEDYERDLLLQKKYRIRDVYPLSPELRKEYEKKKKKRSR